MKGLVNGALRWSGAVSVSMATSVNSDPIRLENIGAYSIQIVWTGGLSPVGTFKLQCSNDHGPTTGSTSTVEALANWTDIDGSSEAIAADGDITWTASLPGYRWVRVVFTSTSGDATLAGRFNGKG